MSISNHLISRLRNIDWDFPGSPSESPFSAIHWHPARFASQVPSSLIGLLSKPGDLVLDPFVGSGTTLVEAQRLGRRSIGIDLSPIACLIARAKTIPSSFGRIERAIERLDKDAQNRLAKSVFAKGCKADAPASVQQKWYTTRALDDLAVLWSLIGTYAGIEGTLSKAVFSAILLPVCRETRHWGYVCDNSTPHGSYDRDVLSEYQNLLKRFHAAYAEREADRSSMPERKVKIPPAKVHCGDVRQVISRLPPESIDLVVTSPPYFGVSDYTKAQRLSMEWFGIEIEPLRLKEIGARSKRHRTTASDEYLSEIGKAFAIIATRIRKGGLCVVIVGESSKRDSLLESLLAQLVLSGMKSELDLNRRVSSLRRQLPSITGEHLFVLSK
jgi:DNA methylase